MQARREDGRVLCTGGAPCGGSYGGLNTGACIGGATGCSALVHQGGPETHKDPGTEIWVYDLASRRKVCSRFRDNKPGSIQVSQE